MTPYDGCFYDHPVSMLTSFIELTLKSGEVLAWFVKVQNPYLYATTMWKALNQDNVSQFRIGTVGQTDYSFCRDANNPERNRG